jgi:hypothetical protein
VESRDESQQGYPEEAPPGAEPGGHHDPPSERSEQRQGGKAGREHPDELTETGDDGTATGNPASGD